MSVKEDTPPNFIIIKGCAPNLQRTIPEMVIDEKKPEDLDTTLEDHAVDACRYALTHIQAPDVVKMTDNKEQMKYEALINPVQEGFRYEWKD